MKKILMVLLIIGMSIFPVETHAQDQYRFLAIGDSITLSNPTENIWWNKCGMAASTPEKDWVHLVTAELKNHYSSVVNDVFNVDWERHPEQLAGSEEEVKEYSEGNPYDLVVVQNADPIFNQTDLHNYEPNLRHFIDVIRQYNPQAKIILINDFMRNNQFKNLNISVTADQILNNVAKDLGCDVVDLSAVGDHPSYQTAMGTVVYGSDGQAHRVDTLGTSLHPGDKGMAYIASKVLEKLGMSLQTNYDFSDAKPIVQLKGWQKIKSKTYYYLDNKPVKGLYYVGTHYYYFNDKTGALTTQATKSGNTVYYLNNKGILQLARKGKIYYNENYLKLKRDDGVELENLQLTQAKINSLCKKVKGKGNKLKKCFQWINRQKNSKKKTKDSYAQAANDFFNKKITDQTKNCAFAYMAYTLGYKNVKIGTFKKHCVTIIKNKLYDPSLKKDNYAQKVKEKYKSKKVPYGKSRIVNMGKATAIVRYNTKEQKLYYNNGELVKGIAVYQNKFYAFDQFGNYNRQLTKDLRKDSLYFANIDALKQILGEPLQTQYTASCIADGDDGILLYKDFTITTYRKKTGEEVFISAKSNYKDRIS